MKFRQHKGNLARSMQTVIEISTKEELIRHLNKLGGVSFKPVVEVKFQHTGMDERTGWDTYVVLGRVEYGAFYVMGFMDGVPDDDPMMGKYVIIDLASMDYMKDTNKKVILYDTEQLAREVCGIYEFEDAWVCKLVFNHKENESR